MKKFAIGILSVLILLLGGWAVFHLDFASYGEYLAKAQTSLEQLEALTVNPGQEASIEENTQTFISVVHAEDANSVDVQVQYLVNSVVKNTEKAIKKVQKQSDLEILQPVLHQIDALQEKTIDVFSDALDIVNEEMAIETIVEGLESTAFDNTNVKDALDEVDMAVGRGDAEMVVAIETCDGIFNLFTELVEYVEEVEQGVELKEYDTTQSGAVIPPDTVDERAEEVTPPLEDDGTTDPIDDRGDGEDDVDVICGKVNVVMEMNQYMDADIQKKMEQVKAEFAFCNSQGEGCQMKKIKGLCIALQAKMQNSMRQEMKKTEQGVPKSRR